MDDELQEWCADMAFGAEPSAAPPTEAVVVSGAEMPSTPAGSDRTVDLDDGGDEAAEPPDVNAGAKKTAAVFAGALVCAAALIVAVPLTFGDTAPPPPRHVTPTTVSAAPAPPPTTGPAEEDQAVPYTASADCPAGSTSAQALTDTTTDSAWVCVRGAQDATVDGQVLRIDLHRSYVLAAVSITPGWVAKTPGGKDEWLQHRVVTRVQYIFNDADTTVFAQDTGNTHGPVAAPLPHKLVTSHVTMVVLQTARPPAAAAPSAAAPTMPGFGDSMLGPDAAPLTPDTTATTDPGAGGENPDPVDATFAVSALKFLGHEPN